MSRLDFDALWDYEHPDQTETAFRQLLLQAEHSHDRSYHLQLLTQIARTQSLQRKFAEAHQTLDRVKGELRAELVVPTIRVTRICGCSTSEPSRRGEISRLVRN